MSEDKPCNEIINQQDKEKIKKKLFLKVMRI